MKTYNCRFFNVYYNVYVSIVYGVYIYIVGLFVAILTIYVVLTRKSIIPLHLKCDPEKSMLPCPIGIILPLT